MARTAVVTGGMSGIGAATVARLREDGVKVLALDVAPGADVVVDLTDPVAVRFGGGKIGRSA